MSWFGWFLCVWFALSGLASVAVVGKPKKPTTPADAVVVLLLNAALLAGTAIFWPN